MVTETVASPLRGLRAATEVSTPQRRRKLAKVCPVRGCGVLAHPGQTYCPSHTRIAELYNSKRWRIESSVYLRTHRWCERCECRHAVQVHHIEPALENPARFFDPTNYEALCVPCHRPEAA